MNLAEFAEKAKTQPGPRCWLCNIPQAAECADAYRAGTPMSVIHAWLERECGYREASRSRVSNHLRYHLR